MINMNASRAGRFGERTAAARATPAGVPWMRRATRMAARRVQTAAVSGKAVEQGNCFVSVVLLAGGVGKRMGAGMPKQYLPLQGRPMAMHSLETFRGIEKIRVRALSTVAQERIAHPGSRFFSTSHIHLELQNRCVGVASSSPLLRAPEVERWRGRPGSHGNGLGTWMRGRVRR